MSRVPEDHPDGGARSGIAFRRLLIFVLIVLIGSPACAIAAWMIREWHVTHEIAKLGPKPARHDAELELALRRKVRGAGLAFSARSWGIAVDLIGQIPGALPGALPGAHTPGAQIPESEMFYYLGPPEFTRSTRDAIEYVYRIPDPGWKMELHFTSTLRGDVRTLSSGTWMNDRNFGVPPAGFTPFDPRTLQNPLQKPLEKPLEKN